MTTSLARSTVAAWALLALAAAPRGAAAADFAAAGAQGLLVADLTYASDGRRSDRLDSHEWHVRRVVHIEARLAAEAPAEWGSAGPDAAQSARVAKLQQQTSQAATQVAPLMNNVQAILARCGDDDACVERETTRLGLGMAGSPQAGAAQQAGRAAAATAAAGAPKVQRWVGRAQSGSFSIDETAHIVNADPICHNLPNARCTRDEIRKGGGALARSPGSLASVEVDLGRQQLTVQLPMPVDALPYTETITTNEPDGTHETATPHGPQARELVFVQTTDGQPAARAITVPLKGGWRSQAGEQTLKFTGAGAAGGVLTLKWRFTAS